MFGNLSYRAQVNLSLIVGMAVLVFLSLIGWFFIPDTLISERFAETLVFFYAAPLAILIFYIAYKRGHTEHLIDGYLSDDSDIDLDKACLQNTLEQTVLAVPLVLGIQAIVPVLAPKIVFIHLSAFLLGRVLFYFGYKAHPALRFPGFVITYYASMTLLALCGLFFFFPNL